MEKMESALRACMKFYQTYEKQVRLAVIAIVVITALLLFGTGSEKEEIIVEQAGETQTDFITDEGSTSDGDASTSSQPQVSDVKLVVDISGCVKTPGVYEVQDGTRLYEVIEMAGGLTEDADKDAINQAESVTDGQKILIPVKIDLENAAASGSAPTGTGEISAVTGNKVNINKADSTLLQEIPGVGPATADKIIQYRENNGRFQTIEDIKNVSGIGEKTFEKMKDKICV